MIGARKPLFPIRYIEDQRQDNFSVGCQRRGSRLKYTCTNIGDYDLHSGAQTSAGNTEPDSTRRAGNEGHLIFEVLHQLLGSASSRTTTPRISGTGSL